MTVKSNMNECSTSTNLVTFWHLNRTHAVSIPEQNLICFHNWQILLQLDDSCHQYKTPVLLKKITLDYLQLSEHYSD